MFFHRHTFYGMTTAISFSPQAVSIVEPASKTIHMITGVMP